MPNDDDDAQVKAWKPYLDIARTAASVLLDHDALPRFLTQIDQFVIDRVASVATPEMTVDELLVVLGRERGVPMIPSGRFRTPQD